MHPVIVIPASELAVLVQMQYEFTSAEILCMYDLLHAMNSLMKALEQDYLGLYNSSLLCVKVNC